MRFSRARLMLAAAVAATALAAGVAPSAHAYDVVCNDGTISHSGGRPGACSWHGGVGGATGAPSTPLPACSTAGPQLPVRDGATFTAGQAPPPLTLTPPAGSSEVFLTVATSAATGGDGALTGAVPNLVSPLISGGSWTPQPGFDFPVTPGTYFWQAFAYPGYTPGCTQTATKLVSAVQSFTIVAASTPTASGTPTTAPSRRCRLGRLPDRSCTPGASVRATRTQVCTRGYARRARHVTSATTRQVYAEYGVTSHPTGSFEVDHLIPLELAGSNSTRNLWPEAARPIPGFHQKDKLEDTLHARVCAGKMSLSAAQRAFAVDWLKAYRRYVH